jgi:hypothetical protein
VATVKAWVASTAAACGAELPGTVPLHDFYADYGPTFAFQHVSVMSFAWLRCALIALFFDCFCSTAATQWPMKIRSRACRQLSPRRSRTSRAAKREASAFIHQDKNHF